MKQIIQEKTKKEYISPEVEVIMFAKQSILTDSDKDGPVELPDQDIDNL